MSHTWPYSVLFTAGREVIPGMRFVDRVHGIYEFPFDAVRVVLGAGELYLTVDDAAKLIDELTHALDGRTATLRMVS
ncbi:hypothetical protein [Nocardia sp. NPDC050718]|uniref:hypothetical protein n=1 Tax=Nocardia sp. NPDC050718 TaxID=3155788 RepID=UPI0033C5888C